MRIKERSLLLLLLLLFNSRIKPVRAEVNLSDDANTCQQSEPL